jgi:hypothetical protein
MNTNTKDPRTLEDPSETLPPLSVYSDEAIYYEFLRRNGLRAIQEQEEWDRENERNKQRTRPL